VVPHCRGCRRSSRHDVARGRAPTPHGCGTSPTAGGGEGEKVGAGGLE
jgi:hypothetical protein